MVLLLFFHGKNLHNFKISYYTALASYYTALVSLPP